MGSTSKGRFKTLYIKNMDGITSKVEVIEALKNMPGLPKGNIDVGELRPFRAGNQRVTLRATDDIATFLVKTGNVRMVLAYAKLKRG